MKSMFSSVYLPLFFGILLGMWAEMPQHAQQKSITNIVSVHHISQLQTEPQVFQNLPEGVRNVFSTLYDELPQSHTEPLERVEVLYGTHQRRGLASFRSMFIGVDAIDSSPEMRRVIVHEFGHIVDLGMLTPIEKTTPSAFRDGPNPVYVTDPSLLFYELCWKTEREQNDLCKDNDFVSGYAQENAFEDFAESYLLYYENKESFEEMAKTSSVIKKKFIFMRDIVFVSEQPPAENFSIDPDMRVFDLTRALANY